MHVFALIHDITESSHSGDEKSAQEITCEKMRTRWSDCRSCLNILHNSSSLPQALMRAEPSKALLAVRGASCHEDKLKEKDKNKVTKYIVQYKSEI